MSTEPMTIADALAFLTTDTGRVPCSRYGTDSEECAPWAVACHLIYVDSNGLPDDERESLDYLMGLVVNNHDDIAHMVRNYGYVLEGTELAYLMDEVRAWDDEETAEDDDEDSPNFAHDFPQSNDEWEYTCPYCTVRVSKVGGGTLGRAYRGYWHYRVTIDGVTHTGSNLNTGSPTTHAQAASMVADFYDHD